MKKKILGIGVAIILIVLLLLLTGCGNENSQEAMKNETSEVKKGENTINQFYNYMRNQDFSSAVNLFNIEEFENIIGDTITNDEFQSFLNDFYNNFSQMYSYPIENITQLKSVEEYNSTMNMNITEEEYSQTFGSNLMYKVELSNGEETMPDIYILNNDYQMICTASFISYYNSSNNKINNMASDSASKYENYAEEEANSLENVYRTMFNVKFTPYIGEQSGTKVIELLTEVSNSNSIEENKVTVKMGNLEGSTTSEITNIRTKIKSDMIYNVTIEYDENEWVKQIIIEEYR